MSAFADHVSKLINILQSKSDVTIDCFKKNQMIVNLHKFLVVQIIFIIVKKKVNHSNENIVIDNKQMIKNVPLIEFLEIDLDRKLNFTSPTSNIICKSTSSQLNILIMLQKFLSFEETKILINSFVMADFNNIRWFNVFKWRFYKENRRYSKSSAEVFMQKIIQITQRFTIEIWFFFKERKKSRNTLC